MPTHRSKLGSLLVGLSPKSLSRFAYQENIQVATIHGIAYFPKLKERRISRTWWPNSFRTL